MILGLRVTQHQNRPPPQDMSLRLATGGCTIGRKPGNDLVLPDPQRVISSVHAKIEGIDGEYYLTDVSTNGTYLNRSNKAVGKDNTVRLSDGDELTIGEYAISVTVEQETSPLAGAESTLFTEPPPSPAGATTPAGSFIPEDTDFLGEDDMPAGPSQSDHAPGDPQASEPPKVIPEDWDPWSEDSTGSRQVEKAASPPAPESAPSASPPPEPPPTAAPARPAPAVGTHGGEAVRAFLAGAGISSDDLPTGKELEYMGQWGRLLRHMTQGLMANLAGRMNVKNELRLEMTTIRKAENNPLKFSVDVEDALRQLVAGHSKGYLPPLVAVDEAFDDIQAHQMAVMAAMRATLEGLLARFDPRELEKTFKRDSWVGNLLNFTPIPKAKYWDVFTKRYGQIAKDAEKGFMQLFAVEFSRAYEDQIRAFKAARQKKGTS